MSQDACPLFAEIDPNRDFIKKAIQFLQRRSEEDDEEAHEILREFFLESHMISHDEMADKVVKQLTFRDGLVGDKLQAVTDLREMYRFMGREVYDTFTGQRHPKSRELCDMLGKARDALDVLSAGYVDTPGLRFIQAQIDMEDPDADEVVVLWSGEQTPMYEADGNVIKLKTPKK